MLVSYRQPWSLSSRMNAEFDRLIAGTFGAGPVGSPAAEVSTEGNDVVITVDVPGSGPQDVDVTLTGRRLTLTERRTESSTDGPARSSRRAPLRRSFTVPAGTTPEQVTATVSNGVLTVRVTEATKPEPQPHRIAVTAGTVTAEVATPESDDTTSDPE